MRQSTLLFVALDVHKDSTAVAHAAGDTPTGLRRRDRHAGPRHRSAPAPPPGQSPRAHHGVRSRPVWLRHLPLSHRQGRGLSGGRAVAHCAQGRRQGHDRPSRRRHAGAAAPIGPARRTRPRRTCQAGPRQHHQGDEDEEGSLQGRRDAKGHGKHARESSAHRVGSPWRARRQRQLEQDNSGSDRREESGRDTRDQAKLPIPTAVRLTLALRKGGERRRGARGVSRPGVDGRMARIRVGFQPPGPGRQRRVRHPRGGCDAHGGMGRAAAAPPPRATGGASYGLSFGNAGRGLADTHTFLITAPGRVSDPARPPTEPSRMRCGFGAYGAR